MYLGEKIAGKWCRKWIETNCGPLNNFRVSRRRKMEGLQQMLGTCFFGAYVTQSWSNWGMAKVFMEIWSTCMLEWLSWNNLFLVLDFFMVLSDFRHPRWNHHVFLIKKGLAFQFPFASCIVYLHVNTYIYLQTWVIYGLSMLVDIPVPWSTFDRKYIV